MKFKILFTDAYVKKSKKFFKKHKKLISQYEKVLKLLELNPYHPSLRLHKIEIKTWDDIYSVSVNISYRMIIELIIKDKRIIPIDIWSHDQVY